VLDVGFQKHHPGFGFISSINLKVLQPRLLVGLIDHKVMLHPNTSINFNNFVLIHQKKTGRL
jgi:hypothetical protein